MGADGGLVLLVGLGCDDEVLSVLEEEGGQFEGSELFVEVLDEHAPVGCIVDSHVLNA